MLDVRDRLQQNQPTRVSISSGGNQANNNSLHPAISASGRYVAFRSDASNLVTNDTNNVSDIFVYDIETGITNRVSVGPGGIQGNNSANGGSAISTDGRYVAFDSFASNLVADDTNNFSDIFVYDTQTRTPSRVSVDSQGNQANSVSLSPVISGDGRYVVFESNANNLVADDTNNFSDIFVYDTQTRTTSRVSVDSQGNQGNNASFFPTISGDGRYVAFDSFASNLVADDTNATRDVFIYDAQTRTTSRISVDSQGNQGNNASFFPTISGDGRYVAFDSFANNLVADDTNATRDVFVYDTQTRTTRRVSVDSQGNQGNNESFSSTISASGRYVVFNSNASNLVAGDTNGTGDIFVYDIQTRSISRVSVDSQGNQGNDLSSKPVISSSGRYVAFESYASNLVLNDTNNSRDIFVYDTTPTLSNDSNGTTQPQLTQIASDVFAIKGQNNSEQAQLSVKLAEHTSQLVNEVGVFTVDDAQGRINGIDPSSEGYSEAALKRSRVIFSVLANIPDGFDTNLTRKLAFNSNANLRFYLVGDSTTDTVLLDNTSLTKVVFPSPTNFKVESVDNGEFSIAWKDPFVQNGDFNGLKINVKATNEEFSLGTSLQGKPQNELIDLRQVTTQVKADFILNREAAFDNFIGFYAIADDQGGIDTNGDGIVDQRPGDAGYTQAAVSGRVAGIDLTVNNKATANFTGIFNGGSLYAPFMIVNSRPDALLDTNPNNDPQVYFSFLGANSDKADHIRLLGDNTFGFEDLVNGGDKDYNDMTVRINLSSV
jgi:hypothetical protein